MNTRSVAPVALFASIALFASASEKDFQVTGIGGAGGMFTPAASLTEPNLMLVSCDMSGAYRSLDGGKRWEMIHWSQLHSSLGCRPLFGREQGIYWASGPELKLSQDKGKTWMAVVPGERPWGNAAITRLAVVPGNPILFVGTDTGVWRHHERNKTWSQCLKGKCYAVVAQDSAIHASVDLNYFRSFDDGATWKQQDIKLSKDDEIHTVAGGFQALGGKGRLFGLIFKVGVLRSDNMGGEWTLVDQFRDCNDIHVATPEVAYAVQEGRRGEQGVWRTRDGGKTWLNCFRMTGPKANVERSWVQTEIHWGYYITPLGFGITPDAPKVAMVTTQGDIYVTRDGGDSWRQVMNTPAGVQPDDGRPRFASNGLEVTSCWQYLFDPFERDRRYIAYTDIGFARSLDADKTWSWAAKGCPWSNTFYQVVFDPKIKGRLYAATSNRHDIPHWTHTDANRPGHAGGVCVSDDGAVTWRVLGTGLPKLPCTSICIDPKTTQAPLAFYTTLYEGGVYKSTDTGQTWVKKSQGLGNPGNLHAYQVKVHPKTGDLFCSITACRVGAREFPVPGGLWKSADGGESWADITKSLRLHWPGGFALHPVNPDVIYLTAGTIPGGPEGGVYKTSDGGKEWTRVIGDADFAKSAPPGYVHCFFINLHPDNPDQLYAGTAGHGLWFSPDGGKTWKRFERIPFASCQNVAFDPEDKSIMYVSTFGGGVWKGPDKP